ncbi:sodium:solute symporter family protein [Aquimarina rhabdastrellae]
MKILDWIVLIFIIIIIIVYGIKKTRKPSDSESYLRGQQTLPWWTIGLSVMATQASAITFLSLPGQAYDEGLRFVQFYFGLPIAIILLCIFVLPVYYKLNVYTAYEFLEKRFDLKTRSFAAFLFLCQRSVATGLTLFAPSIVLSSILGWNLSFTTCIIGLLVIIYTVSGGTNAVSQTQKQQMLVILLGLIIIFFIIISKLPSNVSFQDAITIANDTGKLKAIDFEFDLSNKYNIWNAILGGTFLFLSYFGTDQSQVQRYLSGKSLKECQLGLLFNAILKIPIQFFILFIGVLVFIFLQFNTTPLHFNTANVALIKNSTYADQYILLEKQFDLLEKKKLDAINHNLEAKTVDKTENIASINNILIKEKAIRSEAKTLLKKFSVQSGVQIETEDTDYIFINFITQHLPQGFVGLLIAIIVLAAMSATAAAINALSTTSIIDFYKRLYKPKATDKHYLSVSKVATFSWGIISIFFAMIITLFDNLIEAVNIIGSLFYGAILGIFIISFFLKKIMANATFIGAIIGELIVILLFILNTYEIIDIAYLWFNLIGCGITILIASLSQWIITINNRKKLNLILIKN